MSVKRVPLDVLKAERAAAEKIAQERGFKVLQKPAADVPPTPPIAQPAPAKLGGKDRDWPRRRVEVRPPTPPPPPKVEVVDEDEDENDESSPSSPSVDPADESKDLIQEATLVDARAPSPDQDLLNSVEAAVIDPETGGKPSSEPPPPPPTKPRPVSLTPEERVILLNKAQYIKQRAIDRGRDCAIPDNFKRLTDQQLVDTVKRAESYSNIHNGNVILAETYYFAVSTGEVLLPVLSKGAIKTSGTLTQRVRDSSEISECLEDLSAKYASNLQEWCSPEMRLALLTLNLFAQDVKGERQKSSAESTSARLDQPSTMFVSPS